MFLFMVNNNFWHIIISLFFTYFFYITQFGLLLYLPQWLKIILLIRSKITADDSVQAKGFTSIKVKTM